ncbi:GGDEF domain-containing protein [Sulfurimonas sp.]|uniref:bifunctional diguanylate cyclase/phosphodiesterase n=1 Tax=Sulfurimonas sp. TaxID=2022749 RepID=UPI003563026A
MGLPIFALMFALILHTFISTYENLNSAFYIESLIVLIFGIYFIFYLIYRGYQKKITDDVSKVFTRTYLYRYIKKELKSNKEYTLVLISLDNLNDINNRYGIKSGDKVLYEVGLWICKYLEDNNITNFPIGHVKGGDFILGLKGISSEFMTMIELMNLKADDLKIDDIEIKVQVAMNDTFFSNDLEYMVENLFEIKEFKKNKTKDVKYIGEDIKPNELEQYVISAVRSKNFMLMKQDVYNGDKVVMRECFAKLKRPDGKYMHQKSYIKVLNRLRLMIDYDYMILEKSVENCIEESDVMLALSVSPTSIRNRSFFLKLKELIDLNPHIKNRIMFILSEKEYYSYAQRYSDILKNIRKLGVKITIDKMGSYQSSFLYFRELDVDAIRMDGIYTKDIEDQHYYNIVNGFSKMVKDSDTKIWMKMIETKQTLEKIKELDIDYTQGKYLSNLETIYEG